MLFYVNPSSLQNKTFLWRFMKMVSFKKHQSSRSNVNDNPNIVVD